MYHLLVAILALTIQQTQTPVKLGPSQVYRIKLLPKSFTPDNNCFYSKIQVKEGDVITIAFSGSMVAADGKVYTPYGPPNKEGAMLLWIGTANEYPVTGPLTIKTPPPREGDVEAGHVIISPNFDCEIQTAGGMYIATIGIERKRK